MYVSGSHGNLRNQESSNVRENQMCVRECVREMESEGKKQRMREKNEVLRDGIRNRLSIAQLFLHRGKKQAPVIETHRHS